MNYVSNKIRSIPTWEFENIIAENSTEITSFQDLDIVTEAIGNARYVLLGEASHGTHEYYTWRAQLTRSLIKNRGLSFVAVEGDWPDCYRLNRFVKSYPGAGDNAYEVLRDFRRWPTWMWANWEMVAFADWLHRWNKDLPQNKKVGFYGLDVYSLWESFETIIEYLNRIDPITALEAKKALKCFEPYADGNGLAYARASAIVPHECENEVVKLLSAVRHNMAYYNSDPEAAFNAEQNARVIMQAERYYRSMIHGGPVSWNIRDNHMVDTLQGLLRTQGSGSSAVVWEHNTHIGDARATDMSDEGMVNVDQLLRERNEKDGVYSVGFGSYNGTVVAGRIWGDRMRVVNLPDAADGSWESRLHNMGAVNRVIFMTEEVKEMLGDFPIDHRAVGVVYNPEFELQGNYVSSYMPHRYDAFIFIDRTSALHPLHMEPDGHEIPETFPFGV